MNKYNWNASDYEQHSAAQQTWARELIEKLALTGAEDVLDLGCGDGKVSAELAAAVSEGSVLGVDNATSMIELATTRYPRNQYPNLAFQIMDASQLSFDANFDVAFSNAALHWVKDHRPVVAGLYQSLKPGGRMLLQMGGKGNAGYILSVLSEIQREPEWQGYFDDFEFPYGFYDTDEYTSLLQDAGFRIQRVALIPKDMQHAGQAGLQGWIRTTWLPYTHRIPAAKRDKFIETLANRYLQHVPPAADGSVHVAMVRLEVEASKPV
jgi:trans-aconitate 2-methyltransferase